MNGDDAQVAVDTLREDVSGAAELVTVAAADVRVVLDRLAGVVAELGESRELHAGAERLWHDVTSGLRPLCPCGSNPATFDGPQRECVLHGDGATFVAYVQALEAVAKAAVLHAVDLEHGERIVTLMHALGWLDEVTSS